MADTRLRHSAEMESAAAAEALVARARRGDAAAFEQLVTEHYDMIYRTAYKWCGNRSDAEDVAQDVSIKLASAIALFDGRSKFASWLYRVTLNSVRDLQRARKRDGRKIEAFSDVAAGFALADQEESTTTAQLWQAVRALPDKQRDAVLLVYAEELSHADAAQIMGCREATVSWHVHAARKALRGLL